MLTTRMKRTIKIMLDSEGFITLSQIAKHLNVSTRTLLRELDDVQDWIEQHDGQMLKKKGKGIEVLGDVGERNRLKQELESEKSEMIYTPEERGLIIRAKMLATYEPTKLFALTSYLGVTESTIANDLLMLEPWFEGYNIRVVRRPGLGILLDGDEKAVRKAIVSLVYEHIQVVEFMDYISTDEQKMFDVNTIKATIEKPIYELLEIHYLKEISDMLRYIEDQMGYHFADNAIVALVIRIAATLKRTSMWGSKLIDGQRRVKLQKDKIFKLLSKWVDQTDVESISGLPMEEILYLTMHIKGAKLRETTENNKISMIEDFRTIQLVKEFILEVERETGIYLIDNEALMVGLVKHLRPALYRMQMDLDIINPLLHEIKDMYPKLFLAISQCKKVIEDREGVLVPEDEVAYLATHIGAVIQKEHREIVKKFQVILACVHGIGASQLLVANIERNFKNIDIIKVVSVMDYKMSLVDVREADLIISTVPIETDGLPCVVVNPILKEEDIQVIANHLKTYRISDNTADKQKSKHLREKLNTLNQYSQIMLNILEHYSFEEIVASSLNDVINYVSDQISVDSDEKKILTKAFEAREEKGSTILSKKGMLLLHCRAEIQKDVCLKIVRLKEPIQVESYHVAHNISTIVVMVGPLSLNQKVLNVLSEVSRSIITSNFSDMIIGQKVEQVEIELNNILDKYYEKQVLSL